MSEQELQVSEATEFHEIAPAGPLTVEDAHVRLQNIKAEREEAEKPKRQEVAEPKDDKPEVQDASYAEGRQEAQIESAIKTTATAFAGDLLALAAQVGIDPQKAAAYMRAGQTAEVIATVEAQAKQVIAKVEDKGKQALLRTDLRDKIEVYRKTLAELQAASQHVLAKVQERQNRKLEAKAKAEQKKLFKECPALKSEREAQAFQDYLVNVRGRTLEEIAACTDHRLLVDAYAGFEKWRGEKPKPVIPKHAYRKGAKPKQQPQAPKDDPEFTAAIERVNRQGLSREDATTIMRSKPAQKEPATVHQLRNRLERTGSLDDAYALLKARKRSA